MTGTAGMPGGRPDGSSGAGRSSPATGRADPVSAPDSRLLPAAGSRTAGEDALVNEGSCQVVSRPPNPASATPAGPLPAVRRSGGRPGQAATATGEAGAAEAGGAVLPVGSAAAEP
ncbi:MULTISPECIES: hypothetical protein [Streptomyces]|uniref:hypothetical protein n=1 Tax=Streptomyces TaxID=1883 RepID=UPI0011CDB2E8|nr:hypothetical protein [Streptomyces sp. 2132.2]